MAVGASALACVEQGAVLSVGPREGDSAASPEAALVAVDQISANDVHTCAVSLGNAYCWGDNSYGQLGLPLDVTSSGPVVIPGSTFRSVVTGLTYTCALDQAGVVQCWGDNERGQLGQGHRETLERPAVVSLPAATAQLAGGFNHACALLENAELWCWGDGNEGQIGRGDFFSGAEARDTDAVVPELVALPSSPEGTAAPWSSVDTGEGHTCALRTDGSLWCWGRNSGRQIGQPSPEGQVRQPVRVGADTDWLSIDAGQNYTCGLKTDRSLWCWGFNMGLLSGSGNPFGVDARQLDVPTRVDDRQWAALSTNMFHSCALDDAAQLWCWGRNHEGALGVENPDETALVHPSTVVATGVALVSAGTFTTCSVGLDGAARCAGKNDRGQLGRSYDTDEAVFAEVSLPAPSPATAATAVAREIE